MLNGIKKIYRSNTQKEDDIRFRFAVLTTSAFVLLLWIIKLTEFLFRIDLSFLGVYPRTLQGLIGIIVSPLIHNDGAHLIANSFPLLLLGVGLIYFYREISTSVLSAIYLLPGMLVWLFARQSHHIGASGVVYGLMFFLLVSGFIKRDKRQLAVSFVVLVLYGGSMFSGLFPLQPQVSWESHLSGAVIGSILAVYYRNHNYFFRMPLVPENDSHAEEESNTEQFHHTGPPNIDFRLSYKKNNTESDHKTDK